jgi:hypothetical protein
MLYSPLTNTSRKSEEPTRLPAMVGAVAAGDVLGAGVFPGGAGGFGEPEPPHADASRAAAKRTAVARNQDGSWKGMVASAGRGRRPRELAERATERRM